MLVWLYAARADCLRCTRFAGRSRDYFTVSLTAVCLRSGDGNNAPARRGKHRPRPDRPAGAEGGFCPGGRRAGRQEPGAVRLLARPPGRGRRLMITLGVAAIIATFAMPGYWEQVAGGYRLDAVTALYRAAQHRESARTVWSNDVATRLPFSLTRRLRRARRSICCA